MACPGLAFQEWATSQGLIRSSPFSELKGAQIAIDGDDYVDRILTEPSTREPLLSALGGFPIALKKHVKAHLSIFDEFEITPRFIFNGLDAVVKDHVTLSRNARKTSDSLDEAWNQYVLSRADAAVEEFGKSCTHRSEHVRRWLVQYLIRQEYSATVAPYSAAAQAIYWKTHPQANADALAGSVDMVLFGAEKVITSFDWENAMFTWTTSEMIRSKLGYSQDQIVDLCLLSGLSILPAPLEVEESPLPAIEATKALMASAINDGHNVCVHLKNDAYLALFKRAKTAVKHVPVIKEDGLVEPIKLEEAFGNVHDCIGRRLPEEVLYYCTRGFINPKFLNIRTQMEIYETAPLDGGRSQIYHQLVQQKLLPIRRQALAVLSHRLHRYYHAQDVRVVCWFDESTTTSIGVPDAISSLSKSADQWNVSEKTLRELAAYDRSTFTKSPLTFAIRSLVRDADGQKTITPRSNDAATLKAADEFLANSVWRFLQGREYIDDKHQLTSWGKAYNVALEHAQENGLTSAVSNRAEAEEAILLALELVRLDILNGSPMFTGANYSGAPLRGSEADKTKTNLISRIACLASFQHRELGFTGPLSRHLLAYQQITATVRHALRDLLEMYSMDMLLSASFVRDIDPRQWSEYGAQLPLLHEPDLGLALVVKSHLDELSNESAKQADISRWFPQAIDIHADLQKAWKLWDAVNHGVQAADLVPAATKTAYSSADKWLHEKLARDSPRDSQHLTNGVDKSEPA